MFLDKLNCWRCKTVIIWVGGRCISGELKFKRKDGRKNILSNRLFLCVIYFCFYILVVLDFVNVMVEDGFFFRVIEIGKFIKISKINKAFICLIIKLN